MGVCHNVSILADNDAAAHTLGLVILIVDICGNRHNGGRNLFNDLLACQLAVGQYFLGRLGLILNRDAGQVVRRNLERRLIRRRSGRRGHPAQGAVNTDPRKGNKRNDQHGTQDDAKHHQAAAALRLGSARRLFIF